MKLPNPERAVITQNKIEGYLLSPVHSVGRHKAAFFAALGYTQAEWKILASDLRNMLTENAISTGETGYGRKFEIWASITGPSGRSASVITAWIILHGEDSPRFITAYPKD